MPKADHLLGLNTPTLDEDPDRPAKKYVEPGMVIFHGVAFLAATIAAGVVLYMLECSETCCTAIVPKEGPAVVPAGHLLLVAIVSGMLGGLIHAISSFTDFAGNRQLLHSWIPWLYLRAPIGALLAVVVYFVLQTRGLSGSCCEQLHTVALSAALTGLFSKQVADKLSDLVDNLFVPSKQPARYDALQRETTTGGTAASAAKEEGYDETIKRVQQLLIQLGFLGQTTSDGKAADDGILDDDTRAAVETFLAAHGVTGDARKQLGDEYTPDFWPLLLDLLESAARP
jgi:hypothetical protein